MSHDARTEILTGGAKALLIINGGGVLALLTLLSELIPFTGKENIIFASIVLFGIACLSMGLVVAAANYYFRYWASSSYDESKKEKHKLYWFLEKASVVLSFILFIVGALGLVIGIIYQIHYGA